MNLVNLIKFVISWKQREQSKHFEVHTADPPVVHLVIVVPVCEQTLRRPVPSRADILSEWRLRVDTSARAEVCQLHLVFFQQNVLSVPVIKHKLQLCERRMD